jgi:hypothetical protein
VPVLVARVRGDEPAWWLAVLKRLNEPSDPRMAILVAAGGALAVGVSLTWSWIEEGEFSESLSSSAISATMAALVTFSVWVVVLALGLLTSHLVQIVGPTLTRAHGGGFGEWSVIANWLVAIDAREEPAGGFRTESFRISAAGEGLRHSRIYDDEQAIDRIGRWLLRSARDEDARGEERSRG